MSRLEKSRQALVLHLGVSLLDLAAVARGSLTLPKSQDEGDLQGQCPVPEYTRPHSPCSGANQCRTQEGGWRVCDENRKGLLVPSLDLNNCSGQAIHLEGNVGVSPRPVAERRTTETRWGWN